MFKHARFCSHRQSVLDNIKIDIKNTRVWIYIKWREENKTLKKKKEKQYFQSKATWHLHQQGAVIKLCPEELQ